MLRTLFLALRGRRPLLPDVRESVCHEHRIRHTSSTGYAELFDAYGQAVERWSCPTFRQAVRDGRERRNARVAARPVWIHEWR